MCFQIEHLTTRSAKPEKIVVAFHHKCQYYCYSFDCSFLFRSHLLRQYFVIYYFLYPSQHARVKRHESDSLVSKKIYATAARHWKSHHVFHLIIRIPASKINPLSKVPTPVSYLSHFICLYLFLCSDRFSFYCNYRQLNLIKYGKVYSGSAPRRLVAEPRKKHEHVFIWILCARAYIYVNQQRSDCLKCSSLIKTFVRRVTINKIPS